MMCLDVKSTTTYCGKEILSRKEVMDLFRLNKNSITRWVGNGTLAKPVRLGREQFWFKESIDKTIDLLRRRSERTMARS